MATNSARVDFDGLYSGAGLCQKFTPVQINRTFPAILNGHLSMHTWNEFCNRVDEALVPANKAKKRLGVGIKLFFGLSFTLVLVQILLISVDMGPSIPFLFFFAVAILMLSFSCLTAKMACSTSGAFEEVKRVCTEMSNRYPDVSINVRDQFVGPYILTTGPSSDVHTITNTRTGVSSMHYIEVSVSSSGDASEPTFNLSTMENGLNFNNGSGISSQKSIAQRLEELDKARLHLTDKEYLDKRQAILADL